MKTSSIPPINTQKPQCNFEGKYYAKPEDLAMIKKFPVAAVLFLILGCLGFISIFFIPIDQSLQSSDITSGIFWISLIVIFSCSAYIDTYRKTAVSVRKNGISCLP